MNSHKDRCGTLWKWQEEGIRAFPITQQVSSVKTTQMEKHTLTRTHTLSLSLSHTHTHILISQMYAYVYRYLISHSCKFYFECKRLLVGLFLGYTTVNSQTQIIMPCTNSPLCLCVFPMALLHIDTITLSTSLCVLALLPKLGARWKCPERCKCCSGSPDSGHRLFCSAVKCGGLMQG